MLSLIQGSAYLHSYRVLSIDRDEDDSYTVEIQLINKNHTFRMRPEEILADDRMTDGFSQRDIRTLTYLGYLGINSPKYKILAQRLSGVDNKVVFAVKRRGSNKTMIKTANEIAMDEDFITGLPQKDAHLVGYTVATEQLLSESSQKQEALKAFNN
jgi:hypothetical protein